MRKALRHVGAAALVAAPALAAALFVTGIAAAPASAHSALISSTPAAGATVEAPLTSVELVFNEPVQSDFAQLVVLGDDGAEYQTGAPQIVGGTVTQDVDSPPDGDYSLSYRVVSADGHPVEGTLTFTMAAGPGTTAPAESTDEPAGDSPGETRSEQPRFDGANGGWILGGVALVAVVVGAAVVVGVAVVALLRFVAARRRRRHTPGDTETDER